MKNCDQLRDPANEGAGMMEIKVNVVNRNGAFLGRIPLSGMTGHNRFKVVLPQRFTPIISSVDSVPEQIKLETFEIERNYDFFILISDNDLDVVEYLKRYSR